MMSQPAANIGVNNATAGGNDQMVKAGFLIKQGGARGGLKNWKRRWVVLRQDYLCYYKAPPSHARVTSTMTAVDDPATAALVHGAILEHPNQSPNVALPNNAAETALLGVMPLRGAKVISVCWTDNGDSIHSPIASYSSNLLPRGRTADPSCCHACKKDFGVVFNTGAPCKNCQHYYCNTCLDQKALLPSQNPADKPSRVCDTCASELVGSSTRNTVKNDDAVDRVIELVKRERRSSGLFRRNRRHLFAVRTTERELWLCAESEADKREWVRNIAEVIAGQHRGTGGGTAADGDESTAAKSVSVVKKPSGDGDSQQNQWEIDYSAITILEKIGDGAFGEVFRGRLWGTDVAVKTIKADQVTESVVDDLKKEVAILSQLRHPNVVLYIGACTRPPNVCIVTEWCDRGSLHDVLHDSSVPLDMERIVSLAVGTAQGINYLHSLERRIIHRDLKSHNILVDRNFNVKVADFGLSHVRETVNNRRTNLAGLSSKKLMNGSESLGGGHYGVFGTPEWMAPEIMEGVAYNQKVDVYSFGIVMSELLTRRLPFRDQYKIKNYMDVVDAVLDDGAMPTLPAWTGERLRRVIESCLSRNPATRPSFMSIILKLRSMFAMSPIELFQTYDLPRLTAMLMSSDRHNQALAAREISAFRFEEKKAAADITQHDGENHIHATCSRCRHAPGHHQALNDEVVDGFLRRLAAMLSSSSAKVVLPAIEALGNLIDRGHHQNAMERQKNLEIVRSNDGVTKLLVLVGSRNESIRDAAARTLLLLTDDMPVNDEAYHALKGNALKGLHGLLEKEVGTLTDKKERMTKVLEHKVKMADSLRAACTEASKNALEQHSDFGKKENAGSLGTSPGMGLPVGPKGTQIRRPPTGPSTEKNFSRTGSNNSDVTLAQKLQRRQQHRFKTQNVSMTITATPEPSTEPTEIAPGSEIVDPFEREKDDKFQDIEEVVTEPAVDDDLHPRAISNAADLWAPTPLPNVPAALEVAFGSELIRHGFAFWRDLESQIWHLRYLALARAHIHVYTSEQTLPDQLEHMISSRSLSGKSLKVKVGRKFGAPFCFHLCSHGIKWWFAVPSLADAKGWASAMHTYRRSITSGSLDTAQTGVDDEASIDALRQNEASADDSESQQARMEQEKREKEEQERIQWELKQQERERIAHEEKEKEQRERHEQLERERQKQELIEQEQKEKQELLDKERRDQEQQRERKRREHEEREMKRQQEDERRERERQAEEQREQEQRERERERKEKEKRGQEQREQELRKEEQRLAEQHQREQEQREAERREQELREIQEKELQSQAKEKRGEAEKVKNLLNALSPCTKLPEEFCEELENQSSAVWYANIVLGECNQKQKSDMSSPVKWKFREAFALLLSDVMQLQLFEVDDDGYAEPTSPLRLFSLMGNKCTIRKAESGELPPQNKAQLTDCVIAVEQRRRRHPSLLCVRNPAEVAAFFTVMAELEETMKSSPNVFPSLSRPPSEPYPQVAESPQHRGGTADDTGPHQTRVSRVRQQYMDALSSKVDPAPRLQESICADKEVGGTISLGSPATALVALPECQVLPKAFASRFGRRECWHFGYVVVAEQLASGQWKWSPRFVVYVGGNRIRLVVYSSSSSDPDQPLLRVALAEADFIGVVNPEQNPEVIGRAVGTQADINPKLTFAVEVSNGLHLFAARTQVEKNKWISLIERVSLLSRAAPDDEN